MLKSKSKAFKPKGPGRRPQPSREPTPSLKRKERDDDTVPHPPPKRIPSPTPADLAPVEERPSSPVREAAVAILQQTHTTPEPTHVPPLEVLPVTTQAPPVTNTEPEGTENTPPVTANTQDVSPTSDPQFEKPQDTPSAADEESLPSTTGTSLGPAGGAIISDARATNGGTVAAPLGPAGDVGTGAGSNRVARVSEVVPMAALNPDGTSGGIIEEPATKGKKKKIVRRKKVQAAQEGDDVRATVEMQLNRPRRANKGKSSKKKGDRRKKQRAMTPEGAEEETVDPSTLTMSDLCKDLRIGKKFSRHQDIKDRIMARKIAVQTEKLRKKNPELISLIDGEQAAGEGAAPAAQPQEPTTETAQGASVRMRIVDGQIVLDEISTQIDRHKEGQADQGEIEVVEENDFTRVTTSGTHMKRERAQVWDMAAMEMFYKGLKTFGTDFEMIAKMFPHRNRRQIKLKFNKEERENPNRITRALTGPRLAVDFSEYQELTREKLQEVEEIEAERLQLEREHNAEQAKHAAESAEAIKKKKEAIQAKGNAAKRILAAVDDDDETDGRGGGESAKENREPSSVATGSKSREASAAAPGRNKKKTQVSKMKKNKHSYRAGGEEVEVFGDIQ